MERAVLDRIENGTAVLLVGDAEEELRLPAGRLPAGAREGDWFQLDRVQGRLVPDQGETARRRASIRDKMARLRRRS